MKTLTLKKPETAAAPALSAAPATPQQEGIYVSSRHRNPLDAAGASKPENWTVAVVLAAATAVLFIVLAAMQYMDFSALSLA